jgi:FKBP-type peptidyl-prolyl cis-trans isomerase FkpA
MQQKQMNQSQKKNLIINMRFVTMALAISLLISACSKDKSCKNVPPADEATQLEAFNASHSITATKHYSGLYYQIITPGGATKPLSTSTIYVKYKGTKLDDTEFDSQTNPGATGFSLSTLIEAWKIGIPMIGKGGRILLTVPSGLGYGCVGAANPSDSLKNIPPNTPLYFEIDLVDFY